jgi:DNA adenine methylase
MKSPLNYLGGKSRLAKTIVPLIPPDHTCYCEPFCGAAWILFAKEPSKVEVINDMDNELVNFFRVIQHHLQPFVDYFKFAVISRQLWEWENQKPPETLTDIQRAVRYYYLQRLGFGGKVKARTFGTGATRSANLNLSTIEERLLEVHWRLERVTVEHLDGLDCIGRYDRPETFFYVDPPYYFNQADYAVTFNRFEALADVLAKLKGRFILSLNDCKEVRRIFARFQRRRIGTKYSCSGGLECPDARSEARFELLIYRL